MSLASMRASGVSFKCDPRIRGISERLNRTWTINLFMAAESLLVLVDGMFDPAFCRNLRLDKPDLGIELRAAQRILGL